MNDRSQNLRLCCKKTGGCINNQHGVRSATVHVQDQQETNSINYNETLVEEENDRRPEIDNPNHKIWVRNLSKTPLTEAEERLLAHGPNFAVVPREPPILEYITAIESTCTQLQQGKVEELRGEIKAILKKISTSRSKRSNITKEEHQAL